MKAFAGKRTLMLLENCPYPEDSRVSQEAAALTDAGYKVTVICPVAAGQPSCSVENGVSVYRYAAPRAANTFLGYCWEYGWSMIATFILSLLVLWRDGFDVVHAHNPPDTFVFIALLYKALGKQFVYDHHDLAPEMYEARFGTRAKPVVRLALVFLEKLTYRVADRVIVPNESYKRIAQERGRVPEDRITVVRNGPDLKRLQAVAPDPALRARAPNVIVYVGVMGFQDGLEHLLRALHHCAFTLRRTDFFCVLVGKGDALAGLKELARGLALEPFVGFTGWVSEADLLRYLSTADICVAPDPLNPFTTCSTMIKVMEYMALSKPIVAFDLVEHRVSAGPAAFYARPNDELDFARGLVLLMDSPALRQRMGAIGRARIETQLQWPYSAEKLVAAYAQISSGKGAGRARKSLTTAVSGTLPRSRQTGQTKCGPQL